MSTVTLIATKHKERGICTSNELYKIIDRISPEIIFEEIAPSKFESIYEGASWYSLETDAIKAYLKTYPITHLPVDLNFDLEILRSLKKNVDAIFDIFNDYNSEYNYLSNLLGELTEQLGFPYLNSNKCQKLMERKLILEEAILKDLREDVSQKSMNHEKLAEAYKKWVNFIERRDDEMIKNIYNYSSLNKYDKALFLVGAQHRKPIMDKVSKFEKDNKQKLDWNFNYFI
jgi:pheromone shutdown protein TraB